MPTVPLANTKFQLDIAGIAGFLGGDDAVNAMVTVFLYHGRQWLGWYNAPGSFDVAKKYGQLARSGFWDAVFSGPSEDPATFFGYDGKRGPMFTRVYPSLGPMETGHLGYMLFQDCKSLRPDDSVRGRYTSFHAVTVVNLDHVPAITMQLSSRPGAARLSTFPILTSFSTTALCGYYSDWYCFTAILLGIITNGLSCLVIGSAIIKFSHPRAAQGSSRGDGVFGDRSGNEAVILLGPEDAVNSVTRGKFDLHFRGAPELTQIGLCSVLMIGHLLAQVILIPQGTLFGQIMFLTSFIASGVYNSYLSSINRDRIERCCSA